MFKSITTFVTNAVTKYKAQRVRDVVSQFYRGVVQVHRGLDDRRQ